QQSVDTQHNALVIHQLAHAVAVFAGGTVKSAIEEPEEFTEHSIHLSGEPVPRGVMAAQQQGGKCWRKGERVESGDDSGNGDRHRELLVELTREAGHESKWDEDGNQG